MICYRINIFNVQQLARYDRINHFIQAPNFQGFCLEHNISSQTHICTKHEELTISYMFKGAR